MEERDHLDALRHLESGMSEAVAAQTAALGRFRRVLDGLRRRIADAEGLPPRTGSTIDRIDAIADELNLPRIDPSRSVSEGPPISAAGLSLAMIEACLGLNVGDPSERPPLGVRVAAAEAAWEERRTLFAAD